MKNDRAGWAQNAVNPLRTSQGEAMTEGKFVAERDGLVKGDGRVGSAFHGMQHNQAVEDAACTAGSKQQSALEQSRH